MNDATNEQWIESVASMLESLPPNTIVPYAAMDPLSVDSIQLATAVRDQTALGKAFMNEFIERARLGACDQMRHRLGPKPVMADFGVTWKPTSDGGMVAVFGNISLLVSHAPTSTNKKRTWAARASMTSALAGHIGKGDETSSNPYAAQCKALTLARQLLEEQQHSISDALTVLRSWGA